MSQPSPVAVRPATPADAQTIADFNIAMARETESLELDPQTVLRGVEQGIADAAKGLYWVATRGGAVVGCLLVTREWSDWRNGQLWWIQSVYVAPDHRRTGVFRGLYEHVRTEAKAAGAIGLRLYVEQENTRAQETYRNLGMKLTHYKVMEEVPLSARNLRAGGV